MRSATFLKLTLALYLGGVLLVGGFNALVAPYAITDSPRIEGFNAFKPEIPDNLRIHKLYQVAKVKPQSLILGTSRAGSGLDPLHPVWGGVPTYNLGLPGATPYESLRWLQHAHALSPIRRVVMGLDPFVFNRHFPGAPSFDETRLAADADGEPRALWSFNRLAMLTSWDLLGRSLDTVRAQQSRPSLEVHPNGRWYHHQLPAPLGAFRESERIYLSSSWFPAPTHRFGLDEQGESAASVRWLGELIRFAKGEGMELHLFISPSHARQWEAAHAAGLWPSFEQWKRLLTRLAASEAVPLWDFSGATRYTSVPPEGEPRWHLESSHYRKALGDRVLERLLGGATNDGVGDSFGVRLTPANLEAHLGELRDAQARYRAEYPSDAADITRIAAETAHLRRGVDPD